MQSEPERLNDDEVYELDREAWNLPRPRAQLVVASAAEAQADDSGDRSRAGREGERAA